MEFLKQCPVCGTEKFEPFISGKDYFLSGEDFAIVKCAQCGFRFTNPRPLANELGRFYESTDYISHSNSRQGIFAMAYQQVRKYTLRQKYLLISKFHKNASILDIGCATGQFLNYMSEMGWKTTGIEPDTKTRTRAQDEFGLEVYGEEQLGFFEKESFDVITMWHVLEHVAALDNRMEQLRKLLKPEGTIIVAVPNCESPDAVTYGKFWAGYDLPRHLYHFSKKDITALAGKYNFRVETVLPMKFDSYYVSLLSEKYKHGRMRFIPALWNGFWSNNKAGRNNNYSSLIYILKTK